MERNKNVLVSGASFAGLTTAYWMHKMGYSVTVVEIGSHLKMGGTPVDIKDRTVDIVQRMGLYDQIKANRIGPERWEFVNADGVIEHTVLLSKFPEDEFEVERDILLNLLFELIKDDVNFLFKNSIESLEDKEDFVKVMFKDGSQGNFDLVFGCDGVHSAVRRLCFGDESEYMHFLGQYFSIAIADKLLVEEGTYQMYSEPNKGFGLYAYNNKTDIVFTFRPEKEIGYNYRDQEQMKRIVSDQMRGLGWRAPELEQELLHSESFYFDKFCQIKMASWTKGRVALVGDAGYCASPAAGMGGSLAIIGATALADALQKHDDNFALAFKEYNNNLRPFIEEIQTGAIAMLEKLLPRTEEEIKFRNQNGFDF